MRAVMISEFLNSRTFGEERPERVQRPYMLSLFKRSSQR